MSKVVGAIIAVLGFVILAAGACAAMKPKASMGNWAYEKYSQENPILSNITEAITGGNPYEGDIIAEAGSYVIGVNHNIGIFDVTSVDSPEEAKSTAQTAGLATAGFGLLLLVVGGVTGSSNEKVTIVEKSAKESSS